MFYLIAAGKLTWGYYLGEFSAATLAGNVLGKVARCIPRPCAGDGRERAFRYRMGRTSYLKILSPFGTDLQWG